MDSTIADKKKKALLVIEQCNPEWFSVPLVGYLMYREISQLVDATLVTHERNREALEKIHADRDIIYISESAYISRYERLIKWVSTIGDKLAWPLYNALGFVVYDDFDKKVYKRFKQPVMDGEYDLVHSITPMMPRYSVRLSKVCKETPFVIGPVNGGVPFPKGFKQVANQEFAYLNFIRSIGRYLMPGYKSTYRNARYVLSGSSYTLSMLRKLFKLPAEKIGLFFENGIKSEFLAQGEKNLMEKSFDRKKVNLLFVGRLVPYKGADMVLEAINCLDEGLKGNVRLTVVGSGSEESYLKELVERYSLQENVHFAGWVSQEDTLDYYRKADIFCFPSVREFGGAVVLEAMANALPCIVVDNGGIGEFVNGENSYKIEPHSKTHVVNELAKYICHLAENPELRKHMSKAAIDYARGHVWSEKAKELSRIYQRLLV